MKKIIPIFTALMLGLSMILLGQQQSPNIKLEISPSPLEVDVEGQAKIKVKAFDENGKEITGGVLNFLNLRDEGAVPTSGIQVDPDGTVTGRVPGPYRIVVMWAHLDKNLFKTEFLKANVKFAEVSSVEIKDFPENVYSGSVIPLNLELKDAKGFPMPESNLGISTSNKEVAEVDQLLNLYAKSPGRSSLSIKTSDGKEELLKMTVNVLKNPVTTIDISVEKSIIRTGDVLPFKAIGKDRKGKIVKDVPLSYAVSGEEKEKGAGASAMIEQDGRFVAEKPGTYTVIISCGDKSAVRTIKVVERNVSREIKVMGQGKVQNKHTSDFWVWEGVDGKDYAVTGTWGADGKAYFWHVTDPSNITLIDSFQVDARTVNDVKVSADGKICVISREGASSRKNGIVILDVTNPYDVKQHSTFTETLTGGVHNVFIYEDHVYALSNSQRYDIINIEDPKNPKRIGKFEIDNPARSIHDVWVEDGIAYSSNWNDGVIMVDVGNGIAGGSPSNPVEIARGRVEGDANHAAFPFRSESAEKFYVIAGDEIFPTYFFTKPNADMDVFAPKGYLHFMDFSDLRNPKEVARYEVPEAGSHNFWVQDDLLYIGYYNGGVRVVDVSGDLMGDLYKQGREVAHFVPTDPEGYVPNHAMTWGAQPHKGYVFFSDFNSGLWAVKVEPQVKEGFKN